VPLVGAPGTGLPSPFPGPLLTRCVADKARVADKAQDLLLAGNCNCGPVNADLVLESVAGA